MFSLLSSLQVLHIQVVICPIEEKVNQIKSKSFVITPNYEGEESPNVTENLGDIWRRVRNRSRAPLKGPLLRPCRHPQTKQSTVQ